MLTLGSQPNGLLRFCVDYPVLPVSELSRSAAMSETFPISFAVTAENAGTRLDQFLVTQRLARASRGRVQELIAEKKVLVNDFPAKASLRLRGGEKVEVVGTVLLPPSAGVPCAEGDSARRRL